MSDRIAFSHDRPRSANSPSLPRDATASGYGPTEPRGLGRPARRWLDRWSDTRSAVAGLALVAPLTLAMMVGSTVAIILASVITLAVSILSPATGLIAVAFIAPYPRPLVIPTPGLYVALIGAIFLGVVLRLPVDRPRLRWPSRPVWLLGAYLLFVAVQFLGGLLDGPSSTRGNAIASSFSQIATGVLIFVAASVVLRGRSPYPVVAALLASAIVASATALAQAIGADGFFGGLMGAIEEVNRTAVDRVTGPFLDPNYFGAYLATATTLGLACALIARSPRLKVVLVALSGFVGVALVLTLSRGALAALVAGLAALAFTRGRRAGLATIASILLIAVVAWPLFAEVRYAANPDLASGGLASQLDNSDRTEAWLAGMDVFLSSPIFGIGWGRLVETASSGIAAHNWYVGVLGETGITGIILWALFIVSSVLTLRREPQPARTVGYSVLATWMAASLFIEVPKVYGSTGLALIVLAAAMTADWRPQGPRGDMVQTPPLSRTSHRPKQDREGERMASRGWSAGQPGAGLHRPAPW